MIRSSLRLILMGTIVLCAVVSCQSQSETNVDEDTEEAPEEASSEINEQVEESIASEAEAEESDTIEYEGSSEIEDFYSAVIHKIDPGLTKMRLEKKGLIEVPPSLAEDFEGGGIFPTILEVYKGSSMIGIILFDIDGSYPNTFSFDLLEDEDGFYPPIVHYEMINVAHHPVLKVIRSKSGLLDEGPFIQSYYSVRGVGQLPSPLLSAPGNVFSEEEEGKVANILVDKYYPIFSYTKNCPEDLEDDGPRNIQLDYSRYGILSQTEYTGFTTELFYYYPTDSTMIAIPLRKHMVSPDNELIEGKMENRLDTVKWEYIQNDRLEAVKLKGSAKNMVTGTFCR